ncbi:MAG: (Fe-S)-binding protein [Thermodesulfobacteriota bacterium]
MLLTGYSKEMFRPKCNPQFQSVHCVAHLDEDISGVLPYLNSSLGGSQYVIDPPSVTLRVHGKLITLHAREIFINALQDESEAEKVLGWLTKEINATWERRDQIEPRYEGPSKPQMIRILKLLPKTNCGRCGEPTCMVFAVQAAEGVKTAEDCPELDTERSSALKEYLAQFEFDL